MNYNFIDSIRFYSRIDYSVCFEFFILVICICFVLRDSDFEFNLKDVPMSPLSGLNEAPALWYEHSLLKSIIRPLHDVLEFADDVIRQRVFLR